MRRAVGQHVALLDLLVHQHAGLLADAGVLVGLVVLHQLVDLDPAGLGIETPLS